MTWHPVPPIIPKRGSKGFLAGARNDMRCGRLRGFTLIELLVVIAISSILITLLMVPLVDSFTITERARTNILAQASARQTLEQVTRDVQSAIYVYDNSGQALTIPISQNVSYTIPYGRLDLVPPKMLMHCDSPDHPAGEPRDFVARDSSGLQLAAPTCPYDKSNLVLRPVSPPEPDSVIVRYFIGLKDPSRPYSNTHVNGLALATDTDNTFVLYRAVFSPYDKNLIDNSGGQNGLQRPDFFYDTNSPTGPGTNNKTYGENWQAIAEVVGPTKDVDLISVQLNSSGNPVGVTPSIQFVPRTVKNDALTPTEIGRSIQGEPASPPTVYRGTSGQWAPNYQVRLYRDLNDPNNAQVYYTATDSSGNTVIKDGGATVFNITAWDNSRTITPANPSMMFTVDPNKGQVSFAFPMAPETFDPKDINAQFNTDFAANGVAVRKITLASPDVPLGPPGYAQIVPGSEVVTGPDWHTGPNYGQPIEYSRVALLTDDPGPNQYRINYQTGEIYFYSLAQAPMPEGAAPVTVSYSVQDNQGFDSANGDILSADYVTKNVLSAQVAYRIYDDRGKVEQLQLTNNVVVRNFHR